MSVTAQRSRESYFQDFVRNFKLHLQSLTLSCRIMINTWVMRAWKAFLHILGFNIFFLNILDTEDGGTDDRNRKSNKGKPSPTEVNPSSDTTPVASQVSDLGSNASATCTTAATSETHVSWVYALSKSQVQCELSKHGLSTEGNANQLRAVLVQAVRDGKVREPALIQTVPSLPHRQTQSETVTAAEREMASIREILRLPPTANFSEVQRTLTARVDAAPNGMNTAGESPLYSTRFPTLPLGEPQNQLNPNMTMRSNAGMTDTALLCNTVRKWNLRFDGKRGSDAISFIERLHELVESYEVAIDDVVKALPELLKDNALLWYRNNREFWAGFWDFLRDFQMQYFPPGYTLQLDDEIRRRTQGEGEVFRNYVVAISTLMRRRGGFTVHDKLDRIYMNMHPNYKLYVRRRDFKNLAGLMKVTEEYETCLRERSNFRPPPSPAQALVPETAYQGKHRFGRNVYNTSVLSSPLESSVTTCQSVGTQTDSQVAGRNLREAPTEVNKWKIPRNLDKSSREPKLCWNCGITGHTYRYCRRPKVLRCFHCQKPGVKTTSCNCKDKGNEMRTSESRGHRSPRINAN